MLGSPLQSLCTFTGLQGSLKTCHPRKLPVNSFCVHTMSPRLVWCMVAKVLRSSGQGQGKPHLFLKCPVYLQWTTGAYDYIQYLQNSIPK